MLETRAIIVHKDERSTLVEASGVDGCSVCDGKGCGSSKLTQLFCSQPRQFKVNNPINAAVGEEVIVSVVEGTVLRGIVQIYLLPLACLFAGAAAGGDREDYAVLGALAGLIIGFALSKWLAQRQARLLPGISRIYKP